MRLERARVADAFPERLAGQREAAGYEDDELECCDAGGDHCCGAPASDGVERKRVFHGGLTGSPPMPVLLLPW